VCVCVHKWLCVFVLSDEESIVNVGCITTECAQCVHSKQFLYLVMSPPSEDGEGTVFCSCLSGCPAVVRLLTRILHDSYLCT